MHIAFIGTGLMGAPMACHLQQAGHQLYLVPNRRPAPEKLLQDGAKICDNLAQAAQQAEIIITIVPDTPDVETILFSENGLAEGLTAGKLFIDMSTISPVQTRLFAKQLAKQKVGYVDAPVSGGDVGAHAASLTIMVGATKADFERAMPILRLMGKTITHIGDVGAGQTCKLANQLIVALGVQAIAEGLLLASKAGVDPAKVREALLGGFASSRILELHGAKMLRRDFEPGFRTSLHHKDLDLVLDTAKNLDLPCLQPQQ